MDLLPCSQLPTEFIVHHLLQTHWNHGFNFQLF